MLRGKNEVKLKTLLTERKNSLNTSQEAENLPRPSMVGIL